VRKSPQVGQSLDIENIETSLEYGQSAKNRSMNK
jgi:hypothetical protein